MVPAQVVRTMSVRRWQISNDIRAVTQRGTSANTPTHGRLDADHPSEGQLVALARQFFIDMGPTRGSPAVG
jgi:hypothetical protein